MKFEPELQQYQFGEFLIEGFRDLETDEVWVVLRQVCVALGISNSRDVASRIDDEDKKQVSVRLTSDRQKRKQSFVNESGLYEVIVQSVKPIAKKFRRWLFKEVIPSIRRTGRYDATEQQLTLPFLVALPKDQRPVNHKQNRAQKSKQKVVKMWAGDGGIHSLYPEGFKAEMRKRALEDGLPWHVRKSFQDILRCYPETNGYAILGAFVNLCQQKLGVSQKTAQEWGKDMIPGLIKMGSNTFDPPALPVSSTDGEQLSLIS